MLGAQDAAPRWAGGPRAGRAARAASRPPRSTQQGCGGWPGARCSDRLHDGSRAASCITGRGRVPPCRARSAGAHSSQVSSARDPGPVSSIGRRAQSSVAGHGRRPPPARPWDKVGTGCQGVPGLQAEKRRWHTTTSGAACSSRAAAGSPPARSGGEVPQAFKVCACSDRRIRPLPRLLLLEIAGPDITALDPPSSAIRAMPSLSSARAACACGDGAAHADQVSATRYGRGSEHR